jgi:hypothetical protein
LTAALVHADVAGGDHELTAHHLDDS